MIRPLAFIISATLLSGAAFAGTEVKVPPFSGIDVHGGGDVKLVYGPVQRVTVIKADMKVARIEVKGNTLVLSPCEGMCWGSHPLEVEIVSPKIEYLDIHGGGSIRATGNFEKVSNLKIEVHGGGDADISAIPVQSVRADVHGGGELKVKAIDSLDAEVHGGGDITYVGRPAHISSKTHGGGSIRGVE